MGEINLQWLDYVPISTFLIEKNSFRIAYANTSVLKLLSTTLEDIKSYSAKELIHEHYLQCGEHLHGKLFINKNEYYTGTINVQEYNKSFLMVFVTIVDKVLHADTSNNGEINPIKPKYLNKSLIELSLDSIMIVQDGIIKYTNTTLLKASGFKKEEIEGKLFQDFLHPDEAEKIYKRHLKRQKGSKLISQYESKAKISNNRYVDVEVSIEEIRFENEKAFQVALRDISKRKIAERKYQNIIDFAPIGFYQTTRDGQFIITNNELATILGFNNNSELQGLNIASFYYSSEQREKFITIYDRNDKSDVRNVEIKFKRKDGSPIWVMMTARAIKNENKETINYDGFIIDITKRKINEQEIDRLYMAINQSPSPVALTNLEGVFIYVNPKYCELSGYSKSQLIGSHTRLLKSGKQSKQFYQSLWQTITSGNTWTGQIVNKRVDGQEYIEYVKISPVVNKEGITTHYIKVSNDITEELRIKNELIQAKNKAEESDRLKTAFLANMSHEIRTPMNGILGFSNLLLEPNLNDSQKEEYIKIINQSGERMLNTVGALIEISKIEAGIVDINKNIFNLKNAIEDILVFFDLQAQEKKLTLELTGEPKHYDFRIYTDKTKFESILINLVKNAIKFTNKGKINIRYQINNTFASIYVKDTGIGISETRTEAIFNRFEQADIEDKNGYQGSGLGLAIAKSYVEMLGGKIWVESIINKGSSFCFTIPIE